MGGGGAALSLRPGRPDSLSPGSLSPCTCPLPPPPQHTPLPTPSLLPLLPQVQKTAATAPLLARYGVDAAPALLLLREGADAPELYSGELKAPAMMAWLKAAAGGGDGGDGEGGEGKGSGGKSEGEGGAEEGAKAGGGAKLPKLVQSVTAAQLEAGLKREGVVVLALHAGEEGSVWGGGARELLGRGGARGGTTTTAPCHPSPPRQLLPAAGRA